MKFLYTLAIIFALSSCQPNEATDLKMNDELTALFATKAEFVCKLVKAKTEVSEELYSESFAKSFIDAVPRSAFLKMTASLIERYGGCTKLETVVNKGSSGGFVMLTSKAKRLHWILQLSKEDSRWKVSTVQLEGEALNPDFSFKNWSELQIALDKLPGHKFARYDLYHTGPVEWSYQDHKKMALGSGFKLYILGRMAELAAAGKLDWQHELQLTESLRSLGAAPTDTATAGSRFSLEKLALEMISVSDNTATDMLLEFIGRKSVETVLTAEVNSFKQDNVPFLSTMDMFRFRTRPESEADEYLKLDREQRALVLAKHRQSISMNNIKTALAAWQKPRFHHKVEWFASARDMCETMEWLKELNDSSTDKTLFKILSKNTPFIDLKKTGFKFAGFKGGSEPGVLTMHYLIQDRDGNWGCLSMGWNDRDSALDDRQLFQILIGTINMIAKP